MLLIQPASPLTGCYQSASDKNRTVNFDVNALTRDAFYSRTLAGDAVLGVIRQNPVRAETLDFRSLRDRRLRAMVLTILRLLSLIPIAFKLRSEIALENLALRQQLAILNRRHRRPRLRRSDRVFWLLLSRVWSRWSETLIIVKPETVVRWHRKRFVSYWTRLSRRSSSGRPGKDREIRELVQRIASANVLWDAPRVHGELLKLGINISERTVSRWMP